MGPNQTSPGKNLLCVIFVSETGTHFVAKDTTQVFILNDPPVGIITAPDTTFIWSGDETVTPNGKYYYSSNINGSSSILGTLGDPDQEISGGSLAIMIQPIGIKEIPMVQ
jgi:hypothetical protein